jgi:hypothetical protein
MHGATIKININYAIDIQRQNKLNSLLISYNLFGVAGVPTRLQNNSISSVDNIIIN